MSGNDQARHIALGLFRSRTQVKDADPSAKPARQYKHFEFELISPLLGGGARADKIPERPLFDLHHPLRATELKAQLRFWWRARRAACGLAALQQAEIGSAKRNRGGQPGRDTQGIAGLFGGVDRQGEPVASQVSLRITVKDQGAIRSLRLENFRNKNNEPVHLLNSSKDVAVRKYFAFAYAKSKGKVLTGTRFIVHLDAPKAHFPEVVKALQDFANFGGLGARTRRGFGAVYCKELAYSANDLEQIAREYTKSSEHAQWPHLARQIFLFDGDIDRLHEAYWQFRQGPGVARNPLHHTQSSSQVGFPYWPEAPQVRSHVKRSENKQLCTENHTPSINSCSRSDGTFESPRAAFGLPLGIRLKGEYWPAVQQGQTPQEVNVEINALTREGRKGRWTSPLILRPIRLNDGENHSLAMVLHSHPPPLKLFVGPDIIGEATIAHSSLTAEACLPGRSPSYLANAVSGDAIDAFLTFARERLMGIAP